MPPLPEVADVLVHSVTLPLEVGRRSPKVADVEGDTSARTTSQTQKAVLQLLNIAKYR